MRAQAINVLVVDDSAFMRRAITKILESEPEIHVVATARSGEEALEKVDQVNPDVITMDVEMPGMGGLEAVKAIVAHHRVPIIMVSSLTHEGAETTFRALEFGAVDFIAKPDAAYTNINEVARDLVAKIRTFARRGARPLAARDADQRAEQRATEKAVERPAGIRPPAPLPSFHRAPARAYECVAVGTSTGGPVALAHVIPRLPKDWPTPILIVQHMPIGFTRPLADRLNAQSKLRVTEAANGMILEAGSALVIPSGRQVKLVRSMGEVELQLVGDDGSSLHVPSVDIMDEQVADMYGPLAIGVILTGMGQDGVKGLRKIKGRGGYVIGQDEATCVVYGMPRAAAVAGLVDRVAPLDEIPHVLADIMNVSTS